jgi:CubicO group peptidase (beta-lactamase class C family)
LEDPISKYLDSLPDTWQNITIKQIATHTSGILIFGRGQSICGQMTVLELFKKIKEQAIVFQPGEELRYNQTFAWNDYRKISISL